MSDVSRETGHPWRVREELTVTRADEEGPLELYDVLHRLGFDIVEAGTVFDPARVAELDDVDSGAASVASAMVCVDQAILEAIRGCCRGEYLPYEDPNPVKLALEYSRTAYGMARLMTPLWAGAILMWLPDPDDDAVPSALSPRQTVSEAFVRGVGDPLRTADALCHLAVVHDQVGGYIEETVLALLVEARVRLSELATGLCVVEPSLIRARQDEGWRSWGEPFETELALGWRKSAQDMREIAEHDDDPADARALRASAQAMETCAAELERRITDVSRETSPE